MVNFITNRPELEIDKLKLPSPTSFHNVTKKAKLSLVKFSFKVTIGEIKPLLLTRAVTPSPLSLEKTISQLLKFLRGKFLSHSDFSLERSALACDIVKNSSPIPGSTASLPGLTLV